MSLAKLVFAEPFKPTKHILINKSPFVIGRGDDCDLVIDRSGISKKHAGIVFDGERHIVEDLESKNGILVNGQPVRQAILTDRDSITLGGVDLQFRRIQEEQFNADLQRNLNKIKSAVEFNKTINASQVLDPMLDEIIGALMRLSQAERGFLLMENDQGKLEMARSFNITSEELYSQKFRLSATAIEKAIQNKEAVAVSNALDDSYFGNQTSVQELEIKTLVCVPILAEEARVIGILYADSNSKEQEFAQLDVELLESLASNASIAIANARLNREILKLIGDVSSVLREVEQKTALDGSLQTSVRKSLDSLSTLKKKRLPKEKGPPAEDTL